MSRNAIPAFDSILLGNLRKQRAELSLVLGQFFPNWGIAAYEFGDEAANLGQSIAMGFLVTPFCVQIMLEAPEVFLPKRAVAIGLDVVQCLGSGDARLDRVANDLDVWVGFSAPQIVAPPC